MRVFGWAFSLALAQAIAAPAPGQAAGPVARPRAASLNLCTDELLLLLAAPGQVASVTFLSRDPLEAPWWRAARAVPPNNGQLLSAARTRPQILLTQGGLGVDRARLAARLGLRIVDLPYPMNLADLLANVRRVGAALGRQAAAAAVARRIADMTRLPAAASRSVLFVSSRGEAQGTGGLGDDWLRLAGLRPSFAVAASPVEQLLVRPPRLLLLSDYRASQFSRGARDLVLRAATRRRVPVRRTDGRHWTCMGPSMLTEVARLRRTR